MESELQIKEHFPLGSLTLAWLVVLGLTSFVWYPLPI